MAVVVPMCSFEPNACAEVLELRAFAEELELSIAAQLLQVLQSICQEGRRFEGTPKNR